MHTAILQVCKSASQLDDVTLKHGSLLPYWSRHETDVHGLLCLVFYYLYVDVGINDLDYITNLLKKIADKKITYLVNKTFEIT